MRKTKVHVVEVVPDADLRKKEAKARAVVKRFFPNAGPVRLYRTAEGRVGCQLDLTLVGAKVRLNLSPNLQCTSFLQYDTEDRSFGTNTRLRWTFSPRGDLFVIYNHNLREIERRWRRDSNQLLVKLQYTFRR